MSRVATTVFQRDNMTCVQYHDTVIVSFNEDRIILSTGGFVTATTCRRMNQAAQDYGLDFEVTIKNKAMQLTYKEKTFDFPGDIVLIRNS